MEQVEKKIEKIMVSRNVSAKSNETRLGMFIVFLMWCMLTKGVVT